MNPKDYDHSYKKGLAALMDDEYKEIIQNPRLLSFSTNNESKQYLDIWFGKDSDLRKVEMLKKYYGKVPLQKLEFLLHHASSSIKDKAGELGLRARGRGSDLNPQVEVVKKQGESPK